MTLTCNATSDLNFTVTWEYENEVYSDVQTLVIENTNRTQSGIYKCIVFDGIRSNIDTIQLFVKCELTRIIVW